jgi:hypothetical protein
MFLPRLLVRVGLGATPVSKNSVAHEYGTAVKMIQFLADNGLSPAAFFLLGVVLILWGVRRWTTRLRFGIGLVAMGLVAASAPAVVPIPVALTNAALLKLPAGLVTIPIARFGVNTPGDAPVTWWTANTAGNCAAIGMTSDVGSCNNSADGFAFVAIYPSGQPLSPVQFGAAGNSSTNDGTAVQAALNAAVVAHLPLWLGDHLYKINTGLRALSR